MTSATFYLIGCRLKNQLLSLLRSPAKLIYTLLFLGFMVFIIFSGNHNRASASSFRPIEELSAILTAFYTFIFFLIASTGFSSGNSIFQLADVNILFSSPHSPQQTLTYGLISQLGNSLLMGLFIPFQYNWLHNMYNVDFGTLLLIMLGYAVVLFCAQFTAMSLYSLLSQKPQQKRIFKTGFILIPACFALWLFFVAIRDEAHLLQNLVQAAVSLPMFLFPVSGWTSAGVSGILLGNAGLSFLGLALLVLFILALRYLLQRMQPDYYEDVISHAEQTYEKRADAKSGKIADASPKHLKVGATGLSHGVGASVLYYKHKLENRRSKQFLLSTVSLLFLLSTLAFAFFMRRTGLISIIVFSVYMQVFSISLGRFTKELLKPYIYLIPEPPFQKLLWAMLEDMPSYLVEGILLFIPVGLMLGLGVFEIIALILMRVSFSFLLLSANLIAERLFGNISTKMLIMFFYFFTILILAAPGVLLSIIVPTLGFVFISTEVTVCLCLILCNVPIAVLCIFLCRNILATSEYKY